MIAKQENIITKCFNYGTHIPCGAGQSLQSYPQEVPTKVQTEFLMCQWSQEMSAAQNLEM